MKTQNKFLRGIFEASLSIIPVLIIVTILCLTGVTPLPNAMDYLLLWIGGIVLIIGLFFFSNGAASSLSKIGEHIGISISTQKNLFIVLAFTFILGALVTIAEPSISLLASQTQISKWVFVGVIAAGVGIFVSLGVLRVIFRRNLNIWLIAFYGLTFALCLLVQDENCMPLIFDAGGATTGSATVPFLLSLGAGVAMVRGGNKAKDDTFGLIAVASIGPLLSLVLMFVFVKNGLGTYVFDTSAQEALKNPNIVGMFLKVLLPSQTSFGKLIEVVISIAPILLVFLIYNFFFLKLPKAEMTRIFVGFIYVYIGLVFFLTGAEAVMTPIGQCMGLSLGEKSLWIIILICFALGLATILCEPAIHVLTNQIEKVSNGSISNKSVLIVLSLGVGIAVALCGVRSYFNFSIMYYMVPGYCIAFAMSFLCPPIFTAIAFDSGGVASGPMTTSFVLPFIIGLTYTICGKDASQIMIRGFGVIGMVALTPMIAIQALGIYSKYKERFHARVFKKGMFETLDDEIINF